MGVPEAEADVRRLLAGSVRRRLRADVEVGCYLSGGVDSAIVTHLAREEVGERLRTYSVEFEDPEFDEGADQRRLGEHFGTRHRAVRVSHGDIVRSFPAALAHAEVPVFRTAFVPMYLLSRAVREDGLRVVLTGEGADEAFLGYDIFKETWLRGRWGSLGTEDRRRRVRDLYPYLPHFTDENAAALVAHFDRLAAEPAGPASSHALRFRNGAWAADFLEGAHDPLAEIGRWAAAGMAERRLSSIAEAQWLEFRTLLHGYLLSTQGDRMALAHGVENRCPFLAKDVVEFAGSLPEEWRLANGSDEKRILRDAFRGRLPEWVLAKRKRPYRAPDAAAFFGPERPDYLDAVLSPAELAKVPSLRAERVGKLVEKLARTPPERISPKESQAFLLILSTCLLAREEHLHPAAPRKARRVVPTVLRDVAVETA
jgi:asparagine synthase (glutamine-hydrolysing)